MWREKPLGTVSGIVVLLLIVASLFADVLAPYDYTKANPVDRLQGASVQHPLGTDQLGRDLLSRLLYGARISLIVGLAATAITVAVAVLVGGASGFVGGRLDLMVQRVVDAWMAFPGTAAVVDGNVDRGPGNAADHSGARHIRGHSRVADRARGGDWG